MLQQEKVAALEVVNSEIKEKCVTATLQNTDGMGLIKNAISQ